MTDFRFTEDAKTTEVRKTKDGYLVARVRCARTGIQHYNGDELGMPDAKTIALYRPEEEVFAKDSLRSYSGRPVTNNHPPVQVDSKNWKQYAAGDIGQEIARDGEYVNVPITMMDQALIDDFEAGKKEISMGYTHEVEIADGVAPCGTPYQAVSRNLRMNHLAIVDRGRAGHECRVGDSKPVDWGVSPITINDEVAKVTITLKTIDVDGLAVETNNQGAQAIEKLQTDKSALNDKLDAQNDEHSKALAAKDAELDKANEEIKTLKDAKLDAKALDKLVADRADLISTAKTLAKDADFSGQTDDEVRATVVTALLGADAVKGKDSAYINVRFDIAAEDAAKDDGNGSKFREAVIDGKKNDANDEKDNGQAKYENTIDNAWKPQVAK